MSRTLLLSIHLHDDRWHGAGEWPPSPMRLFQALVAGVGLRGQLSNHHEALAWLEALGAPVIAAPITAKAWGFTNFVPNNDLDAVGGDPRRIGKIRTGKTIKPRLIDGQPVFLYAWPFEASDDGLGYANAVCGIAESLFQFGRGVDMAYATAETLSNEVAEQRFARHSGPVWRPPRGDAGGGVRLKCPQPGTLQSLIDRHDEQRKRIAGGLLRQPRQPRFRVVGYECPPDRLLFDLKPQDGSRQFQPWPLTQAAKLATLVRDCASKRLKHEMPEAVGCIERALIGQDASEADKALRVRIIPLPSIGTPNTDPSIRRVLIERPPDCPIRADDLAWAFSGLNIGTDYQTGEVKRSQDPVLSPADDLSMPRSMLRRYGIGNDAGARTWRTITPAALPIRRVHGEIPGSVRLANEEQAADAVCQALRHAGVPVLPEVIRVQREPFFGKGARAEAFAEGSRFPAGRLWHVWISFARTICGPLAIGDGRYCGLGILSPASDALSCDTSDWQKAGWSQPPASRRVLYQRPVGALAPTSSRTQPRTSAHPELPTTARFVLDGKPLPRIQDAVRVAEWLKIALMSKAKGILGEDNIPPLLSGHGEPRDPAHAHAFFLPEANTHGRIEHVLVHAAAGFPAECGAVFSDMRELHGRDGAAWHIALESLTCAAATARSSRLVGTAVKWQSVTPYLRPWHAKTRFGSAEQIREECRRRRLPVPVEIEPWEHPPVRAAHFHRFRSKRGLTQPDTGGEFWTVVFAEPVSGPLALGFGCHYGLGLFRLIDGA